MKRSQFKTVPWKNGQGETTELAINPGGILTDFDWRLSIASVVENGQFSNFSGYERQLILLKGGGIKLIHNHLQIDDLHEHLSMARFDGSNQTYGELIDGPIQGFNVMTRQNKCSAQVTTYKDHQRVVFDSQTFCFVYAASQQLFIHSKHGNNQLAPGDLMQTPTNSSEITISGSGFVVINIYHNMLTAFQ